MTQNQRKAIEILNRLHELRGTNGNGSLTDDEYYNLLGFVIDNNTITKEEITKKALAMSEKICQKYEGHALARYAAFDAYKEAALELTQSKQPLTD